MKKMTSISAILMILIVVAACNATKKLYKPVKVNHRGEAGVVLLSVNATIPWDEAAGELEPRFEMKNGDAALEKVVRATAVIRQQVLSAFGAGLAVGFPQTGTTLTKQTSTEQQSVIGSTDGQQSRSDTTTNKSSASRLSETKPGAAPEAPSSAPSSTALPESAAKGTETGVDPFLEYKAAQSLYQTVKLLNSEVRNAALRQGYVPHVVMLKLTPMLYRRNLSYDIYTKVSFFNSSDSQLLEGCKQPYVVPILATDNLERAVTSKAVEISRQIGLAVNAMIEGVGVNANLEKLNRDLAAIEANDFNSLLTVGRLTDNSLFVRLGAANQATARYAAIGKTYDIATLVLIPNGYYLNKGEGTRLSLVSYTEFRDADTGDLLDDMPEEKKLEAIDRSFLSVLRPGSKMREAWTSLKSEDQFATTAKLLRGIFRSSWNEFYGAAEDIDLNGEKLSTLPQGYLQSLWLRLAAITANSSFNSASVEIRRLEPLTVPAQAVVLRDRKEKGMEAVLHNVTGARPGGVTALLHYNNSGAEFPAERIAIEPETHLLRLVFASSKQWKLDPSDTKLVIKAACNWGNACPENRLQESYDDVVYLPVPPALPQPKLTLRRFLKAIVSDKGKGGVTLFVESLKEDAVAISLEGARITGAKDSSTKTDIPVDKQRVMLTADGVVDLMLDNLRPGVKVTAVATGLRKDPKTKKLTPTGSKKVGFEVVKAE